VLAAPVRAWRPSSVKAVATFRQLLAGRYRPFVVAGAAAPGKHDEIATHARDRFDVPLQAT
jgi:hypothetical protein